jgi:hypothetical protein
MAYKLNIVQQMMRLVMSSREEYNGGKSSQSPRVNANEETFNRKFAHCTEELAHLETNGYIRRVPGHIYIRLA